MARNAGKNPAFAVLESPDERAFGPIHFSACEHGDLFRIADERPIRLVEKGKAGGKRGCYGVVGCEVKIKRGVAILHPIRLRG